MFWAAFSFRLLHATEPLISLEVLGNRIVLYGTLATFMLQAANIGLAVYLPVYLQSIMRLSASQSGTAMLALLMGTVLGATLSGRTIPRLIHYKRIAMAGAVFSIACLGLLAFVAGTASLVVVEILTACVGIGAGTAFPVVTVAVQNAVDQAHLGVATGVLAFLRSLGSALGVALLGSVALGYDVPLASEAINVVASGGIADAVFDDLPRLRSDHVLGARHAGADAGEAAARQRGRRCRRLFRNRQPCRAAATQAL